MVEVISVPPKQRESVMMLGSDIHWGKKTLSYNHKVAAKRMDALGERLGAIRELYSSYDFDEFVPCILGDANDGTGIYPAQEHYQSRTDVEEQAEEMAEYLTGWARGQVEVWGNVRFECVPGNHGRQGKFAHERANWDRVMFQYLKLMTKEDEHITVGFNTRKQDAFVRKIYVRKHPILLYHGQDVKMYQNIPWYGIFTRAVRWAVSRYAPFEMLAMGHFHSFGTWRFNRLRAYLSGTMVSNDDWALRCLGMDSATAWWLLGISDRHAPSWSMDLELAEKSVKPACLTPPPLIGCDADGIAPDEDN